ncbi:uncharacterized protein LOC125491596 isoform X5 [Beta vulgaris subsp. vulgaris]|uniref:uncharacterized protein LOC125491596 isoform X5 n=1 Tax=Beta vulgaris subsp. vulgaris TaxID=3555 RepID=UPI0025494249|nr:uncharacterized protein LOC125491596 isoform X5 [Beta vulgaris subsp. vulgaris]
MQGLAPNLWLLISVLTNNVDIVKRSLRHSRNVMQITLLAKFSASALSSKLNLMAASGRRLNWILLESLAGSQEKCMLCRALGDCHWVSTFVDGHSQVNGGF